MVNLPPTRRSNSACVHSAPAGPNQRFILFRLCPRGKDFGGRRLEAALDGEAWFDGGLGGHVFSFCDN